MVTADRLDPLPSVVAGGVTFLVDASRPVASLIGAEGSVRLVTWADAPLPARAASGRTLAAPGCVWVVYHEDFAETDPTPTVTAVRIGADAQVATCVLGSPEVIGVDDVGVWLTAHPYPAMNPDLDRGHLDVAVLDEAPEWVASLPAQSWEDFERDQEKAGRADVEAATAAVAVGGEQPTGWFAFSPGAASQPPLPPAPAPVPTGAAVLRRVRPDGDAEEMTVSRVVSQVSAPAPGMLHLVFHPTTAIITTTPDGHGAPTTFLAASRFWT